MNICRRPHCARDRNTGRVLLISHCCKIEGAKGPNASDFLDHVGARQRLTTTVGAIGDVIS